MVALVPATALSWHRVSLPAGLIAFFIAAILFILYLAVRWRVLHDLRREAVVELNPELTESYNGAYPAGSTDFSYTSTPNVGGNVRWRIIPNLTLNATDRKSVV